MNILTISLPPIMTNSYIIYERDGGKCFIVDPPSCAQRIETLIFAHSLTPKGILLTHGHFDHIGAADDLRDKYSVPLYIHEMDSDMITSSVLNCSKPMTGTDITIKPADKLLRDGDKIKLEAQSLRVMHTPGHSPGSCVFIGNDFIISGDTVFKGTYGRYDLPGGNYSELMDSIKRIMTLNPILEIYPGHDEKTTVSEEMIHY